MEKDDEYNDFMNEYGNLIGSIINVDDHNLLTGNETDNDLQSARIIAASSAILIGQDLLKNEN